MAKQLCYYDPEILTTAANKIRTKLGTTEEYSIEEMAELFSDNIGTEGGETPSVPNLQSKTVSPTESQQTVTADATYDGLSNVTVNAISSTYVGSGVARKSSSDLTVSGASVTTPAGYYTTNASKSVAAGSVTVNTPTINSSTGIVTASASVSAGYISGNPSSQTLSLSTQAAAGITPTKSPQTAVAAGKYTTGAVMVNPIPDEYIIPSGSQTLTQNKTYDVTSLESVTINVPGGGTTPTGSIDIDTNGDHDVTDYATAKVFVPPLVYTSSKNGSGTSSIVFNELPSPPVAWALCSNTGTTTTYNTYGIVAAYYNGNSYSGVSVYQQKNNAQSRTYTPSISANYSTGTSSGTLTINAIGSGTSGGMFQNTRTYNLIAVCYNQGGTDVIIRDPDSDEPIGDQETFTH